MGPSKLKSNHPNINQINVVSADEMYQEVDSIFQILIFLFFYAFQTINLLIIILKKLKKSEDIWNISFKKNIDILKEMSKKRKTHN